MPILPVTVTASLSSLGEYDLIVAGAGTAGCCAALAAARSGAGKVLLFDRLGFLGGTSTAVLDTFYGFFTPGDVPRKVVGGLPDAVVDALEDAGGVVLRPNTYGAGTGVTYDPERLKLVWDELLGAAGVEVVHHAQLVDVLAKPDGRIGGVVLATRSGFLRATARRFIDASGDAVLCHLADVPYERAGESEPAQTLTTTFRMAGVDLEAFRAAGGKKMMVARAEEAIASGRHRLPRKEGSFHAMVHDGLVATVAGRVADLDPMDPRELSRAEAEGRRQAFAFEAFVREYVPGYENARIVGLSTAIGVRESRRVYGEYRLTREDCLSARKFDDVVLLCGAPIEDHRAGKDGQEETAWAYVPGGATYDVPYRTLVPRGRDELWVVGRCFSATHDAHASCRSMGQTMSMGQAAGLAAAQALRSDASARAVNVPRLQAQLRDVGAVLETPTEPAVVEPRGWRMNRGARA